MFPAIHKTSSIDWKPSPVVALATCIDASCVAAARADGSLEIWRVSPGTISWHCHLTIHGDPRRRVSSLVWCRSKGMPTGRLLSSSIDGSVSEWDLFDLKQKIVLESNGVSIWQMAVTPSIAVEPLQSKQDSQHAQIGYLSFDHESSESEDDDDDDSVVINDDSITSTYSIAMARDDGCVQLYCITDSNELIYYKSLPRVSGRVLSVAWSPDAKRIYSGSSDGFIRCWDATLGHEIYRITVGLGGLGSASELCIWSLLALSNGTLASADSSGSVQFWDCQHGTLLQAHSLHKGDAYSLAAAPAHNRVFSAGSDGQVILYKLSSKTIASRDNKSSSAVMKKWVYVGYIRAHTHDIRALTVAIPISSEDQLPDKNVKKLCSEEKLTDYSYRKWAHLGIPMLISAGDDTKLFAYPVKGFTQFSPHDICPAPQRVPLQLVVSTVLNQYPLLLVQRPFSLDILCLRIRNSAPDMACGLSIGHATTDLLARVKSKASQKIICSTMSTSGGLFAYSDHLKPNLFELKKSEAGKTAWTVTKQKLPRKLPSAHFMVFSSDSSWLIIAGHDRKIHVVDVKSSDLVHSFTPCRDEKATKLPPREPPVTKMFISSNGLWLAAVNCFGDVYIFNLQIQRQHWFISRLDGASVTAGGFHPQNNNMLIISTSLNQVYAFDVDARKLGEWSSKQVFTLPRSFLESHGETFGLSFSPSSSSSSVIVNSGRAMCMVDFGAPVGSDNSATIVDSASQKVQKSSVSPILKRKLIDHYKESKTKYHMSGDSYTFKDPVLFVGHLSNNSLLVIDKPWMEVVRSLDNQPVHRHIYGT